MHFRSFSRKRTRNTSITVPVTECRKSSHWLPQPPNTSPGIAQPLYSNTTFRSVARPSLCRNNPPSLAIARSLYSNTTASRVPSTDTPSHHPASRGHSIVTSDSHGGPSPTLDPIGGKSWSCDMICWPTFIGRHFVGQQAWQYSSCKCTINK